MSLTTFRESLGLTLEQCAVQLGLSKSSKSWISDIENNVRPASVRLAMRIERWSGGAVQAASVCPDLAGHVPLAAAAPSMAPTVAGGAENSDVNITRTGAQA